MVSAAAKSPQSCLTLCDPRDGSPPCSPVPGILQARTLEWAAISFSNAWKWKEKVKSLSRVRLPATPWTAAHQAPPGSSVRGIVQARGLEWGALVVVSAVQHSDLVICAHASTLVWTPFLFRLPWSMFQALCSSFGAYVHLSTLWENQEWRFLFLRNLLFRWGNRKLPIHLYQ